MNFGTREFGSIEYGGSSDGRIITIDKSLKYTIASTKEVSLGLKYTIDTIPTAIEKSLKYTIQTTQTIEKELKYEVKTIIAIEKSLKYTIVSAPAVIEKSLKYTIETTILINKSLTYNLSLPVTAIEKSLRYAIRTISIKINDVERRDEILLNSLSVENNLYNNADFARFEFIQSSVKTYEPTAGDEIAIYDTEQKIFGGILINISRSMEGFAERYLLEFKDWTEELGNIIVAETYQNQTVNQIVADINTTYLSGYDITNVSDTTNIVRIDFDNISVSECLDKLANLSGKNWLVNYDKKIYLYTDGAISSPFDLTDSNNKYDYRSLKVETDYTQIRNKVSVQGKNIALVTVQDATSQSAYGVREYVIRDSNIESVAEATQLANSILAQFKDPAEKAEFITKVPGLYSGQEINITSTERSLNQDYNIEQVVFQSDHPHQFHYKVRCSTQRQYGLDDFVEATVQEPLETTPVSDQGFSNDIVFSATNDEDITWSVGTIRLADGRTYSISAGGVTLTSDHIIYLDISVSETVLQSSTNFADGMGVGKIPLAYASKSGVATKNADIFPIGFGGKMQLDGSVHITDRSIIADQIAANAITANEIDVNNLFAQEITIANTGHIKGGQTAFDTGTGFFLGYSTDAYKFSIGNASGEKMTWDGSKLSIVGGFETAASGQRCQLSSTTNEFNFYNSDGDLVVKIGTTYIYRMLINAYSGTNAMRLVYPEANAQTLMTLYDSSGADTGTMLSVDRDDSLSDNRMVSITADSGAGNALYLRGHNAIGVPLFEAVHQDLDKTGFFFTDETGNNPNNVGFVEIVADSASGALKTCLYLYASVNNYSHIRFAGGGAGPVSPSGGDFWFDGSDLNLRIGGTTYTLDKTAV